MDLSNLAVSQESYTLTLLHPATGKPLKGSTIDLLSADTNAYAAAQKEAKKEVRNADEPDNSDVITEATASLVSKVSTGCNLEFNGEKLKFSQKNMKELYLNPEYKWIADQAVMAINDRSNFIKGLLKA